MRVSVLASGSAGNSIFVWCGNTRILVDSGLSGKEVARRLHLVGAEADGISDIVITHDHADHVRGMGVFARRHGARLHLTERTHEACDRYLRGGESVSHFEPERAFQVGDVHVDPFVTVHDASDPAGVALTDECTGARLGVATDLGRMTASARLALAGSTMLVLEANHDPVLLHQSRYPPSVRGRIASSHGHLSNDDAARLVVELLHPGLAVVVLAHLSEECNRPELARAAVGEALEKEGWQGRLEVASQHEPTSLFDLAEDPSPAEHPGRSAAVPKAG